MPETCGLVAALVGQASMFVPQSAEAAAALGDAREAARGSAEAAQGSGASSWIRPNNTLAGFTTPTPSAGSMNGRPTAGQWS
jgi:hypothetical protein